MWLLKKLKDDTTKYVISDKGSYSVGRKNCDIILEEDTSVSRVHCVIFIAKKNNCSFSTETATGVWIVDKTSKYGTFTKNGNDWLKLNANQNSGLKNGSIIKFGLLDNIWRLEYKPVVACASGILTDQKKEIEMLLKKIDGELKNVWTKDCLLVFVNEITLTVKVVLALINGTSIVKPDYLEKMIECIKNQQPFPDPKQFTPEIKESVLNASLVSLDSKNTRKNLFKNKKFLIPTKRQMETLKEVIFSAGGEAEVLCLKGDWGYFANKNCVVIQLPMNAAGISQDLSNSFKKVVSFLKEKHKKRVVPESEIAQAVAYSSTEKYCNPDIDWLLGKGINKDLDMGDILVEETPLETCQVYTKADVIPSSCDYDCVDSSQPSQMSSSEIILARKRTYSPEAPDYEKPKRRATIETVNQNKELEDLSKYKHYSENEEFKTNRLSPKNKLKISTITDYFQASRKNDFWSLDPTGNGHRKRKIQEEYSDKSESKKQRGLEINAKKQKVNAKSNERNELGEAMKVLTVSENDAKKIEFSKVSSVAMKILDVDDDDDTFGAFISKDKMNFVKTDANDLGMTLFSNDIISSNYLKGGLLIEPPDILQNVKKFKKQKFVNISLEIPQKEVENKFVDEKEWLEPHPMPKSLLASEKMAGSLHYIHI